MNTHYSVYTRFLFAIIMLALSVSPFMAQDSLPARAYTLREVVHMARHRSPDAVSARHAYNSALWNYRSYRADYLPNVTLTSSPYFNKTTDYVTLPDGSESYAKYNNLKTDLTLNIKQNLHLTGGSFTLSGFVRRLDLLGRHTTTYNVQPLMLTYQQSLFGYNSLKWSRRTEPVRYRVARKNYSEAMELVSAQASSYFFSLAAAQTNMSIAEGNFAEADTLYNFALARYNIGTITENEILQLEVNRLSAETELLNARISLDEATDRLRSYLNITEDMRIMVNVDEDIPQINVEVGDAMALARENNPELESLLLQRLEGESNLARARADRGLKADVYLRVGLSQTGEEFRTSFHNLLDEQYVSLSLSLPIFDWGKGRGQVERARSNLKLVETNINRSEIEFEQRVSKVVKQFNLQWRRVDIARRTKATAAHRYEVARKLYIMGRSTVLHLNDAMNEKDTAFRAYVASLATYWDLYYTLRSLTRYDFERNRLIEELVMD
ncbi:MAG: TolC family protein [Bacteroidaceae bacterium]|nr:TolC family protein [Bacteroidaceae bacterium]